MNYNSRNIVLGRAFANLIAAALKTDPGAALVVAPKIRLSKDPSFNPTPDATIASLTPLEADFTGYTAGGYTWTLSAPVVLALNVVGVIGNVLPMASGSTITNSCYGYWIDDGVNMLAAERFADNLIAGFGQAGDFLDLLVAIPIGLRQPTA